MSTTRAAKRREQTDAEKVGDLFSQDVLGLLCVGPNGLGPRHVAALACCCSEFLDAARRALAGAPAALLKLVERLWGAEAAATLLPLAVRAAMSGGGRYAELTLLCGLDRAAKAAATTTAPFVYPADTAELEKFAEASAASQSGDMAATCEVGRLHFRGAGGAARNKSLAALHFATAALGGFVPALAWMASCHWLGYGV